MVFPSRRLGVAAAIIVAVMLWPLVFAFSGCSSSPSTSATAYPSPDPSAGIVAFGEMIDISGFIGARPAGTPAEDRARTALIALLTKIGYQPQTQGFTANAHGHRVTSANLEFVKKGDSPKVIVVGAHYDSVKVGAGAFDNASGVGVLIDAAHYLRNKHTPYAIDFVLFGAEEPGELGSTWYVQHLTPQAKANVVAMVNLDSVAAGDKLYAYSGTPLSQSGSQTTPTTPRDEVMGLAKQMQIPLLTNPGLNKHYPAGTTGDRSDHVPFLDAGIPYLCFEATNWSLGDKDGYIATREGGAIWHTPHDNLRYVQKMFPGRLQVQLREVTTLLERFLVTAAPAAGWAAPAPTATQ